MVPALGSWRSRKPRGKDREYGARRGRRTIWFRWFLLYPRVCIAGAGYGVVAIFGIGAGVARAFGAPIGSALTVGILAAAPIVVGLIGERITGVKAFGVEVKLTEVFPPLTGGFSEAIMMEAVSTSAVGSEVGSLSQPFKQLIQNRSKLLRINLRDDNYWWSTRIFLVAALAQDYTDVESLVFVTGDDEQIFVGIASPRDVRKRLAKEFSSLEYEAAYQKARTPAATDPSDPDSQVTEILERWQDTAFGELHQGEKEIKQIVSSGNLRRWLRGDLDTHSVPDGPLTPPKQYRIISHDRRYVALTDYERLKRVVDRDELITAAAIERRFGGNSLENSPQPRTVPRSGSSNSTPTA
jgi:hypothetical protein